MQLQGTGRQPTSDAGYGRPGVVSRLACAPIGSDRCTVIAAWPSRVVHPSWRLPRVGSDRWSPVRRWIAGRERLESPFLDDVDRPSPRPRQSVSQGRAAGARSGTGDRGRTGWHRYGAIGKEKLHVGLQTLRGCLQGASAVPVPRRSPPVDSGAPWLPTIGKVTGRPVATPWASRAGGLPGPPHAARSAGRVRRRCGRSAAPPGPGGR